jgi:hypothetical protein
MSSSSSSGTTARDPCGAWKEQGRPQLARRPRPPRRRHQTPEPSSSLNPRGRGRPSRLPPPVGGHRGSLPLPRRSRRYGAGEPAGRLSGLVAASDLRPPAHDAASGTAISRAGTSSAASVRTAPGVDPPAGLTAYAGSPGPLNGCATSQQPSSAPAPGTAARAYWGEWGEQEEATRPASQSLYRAYHRAFLWKNGEEAGPPQAPGSRTSWCRAAPRHIRRPRGDRRAGRSSGTLSDQPHQHAGRRKSSACGRLGPAREGAVVVAALPRIGGAPRPSARAQRSPGTASASPSVLGRRARRRPPCSTSRGKHVLLRLHP